MTKKVNIKSTKTGVKTKCPYCTTTIDAAINLDNPEHTPKPGDITLCIKCGELSIYDDGMKLKMFDIKLLNRDTIKDIRMKQYLIAVANCKREKLQ